MLDGPCKVSRSQDLIDWEAGFISGRVCCAQRSVPIPEASCRTRVSSRLPRSSKRAITYARCDPSHSSPPGLRPKHQTRHSLWVMQSTYPALPRAVDSRRLPVGVNFIFCRPILSWEGSASIYRRVEVSNTSVRPHASYCPRIET